MGDIKFCLLLLLSSSALAQQNEDEEPTSSECLLAARFKPFRKYIYQYTTESSNGVSGASDVKNGPKITCQVEVEVPQPCSFTLHTRDCALSEISAVEQGRPVHRQATGAEAFQAAMEKNLLKFTVEPMVKLFPEEDEPVNILNIKRGIISALIVPVLEDEQTYYTNTVHGLCKTDFVVNARKDIITDVSLSRDLADCDRFHSRRLPGSPLALLHGLFNNLPMLEPIQHGPMDRLFSGSQVCNYQFDNRRKHMTSAECTETHTYLPFSHGENGISSVVTQTLTLQDSAKINNRQFAVDPYVHEHLLLEDVEDKSPVQTKDATLSTLRDLHGLSSTNHGHRRAVLFHKLVAGLRVLRNESLSQAVEEMMEVSGLLTWQALAQCGTPECTSAVLRALRAIEGPSVETDAFVYALGLLPHPDAHRVRDMLSMAEHRQSKAVMYGLANTVRRFHEEYVTDRDVTDRDVVAPEVAEVAEFMQFMLADCSGDEDTTFLTLRVIGVMGKAMSHVSTPLMLRVLSCVHQTDASPSVQNAAIQAFRLMDIDEWKIAQVKPTLLEVYQDAASPVQKRVAAYLILMRHSDRDLVSKVVGQLANEHEPQLKSFVTSHINNILRSDSRNIWQVKLYLQDVLENQNIEASPAGQSRNYRMGTRSASTQANVIFDSAGSVPKEIMLEMTLRAFGYNHDMLEVGLEGNGFEPSVQALFGEGGFFPDAVSQAIYSAADVAPDSLKQVLENWLGPLENERRKRQAPHQLFRDIGEKVQNVVEHLRSQDSPEAMAYLRILGTELGFIKSSDVQNMARTLSTYYQMFFKVLPRQVMDALLSSTGNELYAHYIFMENAFALPTASGLPVKFSLSGVLAPGAKGGLNFSPGMQQLSFMPSVDVGFITHMGVQVPDFVVAGVEMHTTLYHESSLNAKITRSRNQIKLSIPAPKANTQIISVRNQLFSVTSGQADIIPSMMEDRTDSVECQPLFTGLNYCTTLRYSTGGSTDNAPYFPLTGESRFAVEIAPTGDVTEYSATAAYQMLRAETKEGRQKVDSFKLTLRADGAEPTEATATLKYNRNKGTVKTDLQIPDYDVQAGINLAVTDGDVKGEKIRGITLDVTNKNIPQFTLIGRARLESMKDGMLQIQMIVPSLNADASATAVLKNDDGLIMKLSAVVTIPETTSSQTVEVRYDDSKFKVELRSMIDSDIQKLVPNMDDYQQQLQELLDNVLDQKVAKTDMKLRHIVYKGIEAGNIWLDKVAARVPYIESLRTKRSPSELTLPSLPDKLFLHSDGSFIYQFNPNKMAVSLPVPLGGMSSKELNIPPTLSVPVISVPGIGLQIPANDYPIPAFTIPRSLDLTLPLIGLAEVSARVNFNDFYTWEGSLSGGNTTVDDPSYIAQYKVVAQSPVSPLSYKLEGTGMITGVANNLRYGVNGSLNHGLLDASYSMFDALTVTDKVYTRENYKMEASSPLGLQISLFHVAKGASTPAEVTGDGNFDGSVRVGSLYANSTYSHNYAIRPLEREGRGESNLHVNLPFIQAHNMIQGAYANSELSIISKTNVQNDALKHVAELKYKGGQLTLKGDATSTAFDKALRNKVELGVSSEVAILRVESQADDATNRAYSLITGTLNSNGLEVNSEGSLTFEDGRGLHKASVTVTGNGLATSSTTTLQCSPITYESIFNGGLDSSGGSLSLTSKASAQDSRGELSVEGRMSTAEASLNSIFKGNTPDASVRNTANLMLNGQALTFSNNMKGSLYSMKTDNSHTLALTLWTLAFRSKTDTFACDDVSYKHDIKVDMKPFVSSINTNNDLQFFDASLNNEGQIKIEPYKMDLTGSLGGAYGGEHDFKNTYEITYADLAGTLKFSTMGNVMDAQISQNCELEVAGLASKSNCEARINSKSIRFDSTLRTMAQPFSLTIDSIINSDGEIDLNGKHTGQLYSKLLMNAEPLALAYSHNSRVSTTHLLEGVESDSHIDNKVDGLLTPSEQSLVWKIKSKFNDHAYNQDINTYNNPLKAGLEFAGAMSTDLFSKVSEGRAKRSEDNQEFSVSGFLSYDKNSDSHIIVLPFIESFPIAFENVRTAIVSALESLHRYIKDSNIEQSIAEFRANLDEMPQQVSDFMEEMDLEGKVNEIMTKINYLTQEYAITLDDLEAYVENLRTNLEQNLIDVATQIQDLIASIYQYVDSGDLATTISRVLSQVGDELMDFDRNYKIRQTLSRAIDAIEDIIRQIDLQKLGDSSLAWMQDLDAKFGILEKLKEKMAELKQVIDTFDVTMFFQDLKDYILSINFNNYVEQLTSQVPSEEITRVLEATKDIIVNWIEEYEIAEKINAVYFYGRDLLLKYDVDQKIEALMNQAVELIKEYRIQQTVQLLVDHLRSIYFEVFYEKFMQLLESVTQQLKELDFQQSIDELNERISSFIKAIKAFDYNVFVDETNQKINEITNYVNDQIREYEIPQKVEASREFLRKIQVSIFNYIEQLKDTELAEVFKKLQDLIDTTAYNDIKMKAEEMLEDLRNRIKDMDIRDEILIYLQRASESYSNMIAYISVQLNKLIDEIHEKAENQGNQISETVDGILNAMKSAEIEIPSFVVPCTDLVIPAFEINLNKLQDIRIPVEFSVPEFTLCSVYTVPAFTIHFEEIKSKIIALIDHIIDLEIPTAEPKEIFGDLKVLYFPDLPDLTFPEITVSEIKFPIINIPKLNLENFEITMLPIPEMKLPQVPSEVHIPAFGKLYGELRVNSPHYTLVTAAALQNSTTTPKTPQFTATLSSQAKSSIEFLDYSLDATARLEAPRMRKLVFTENVHATHVAFTLDHEGSLTLGGPSAEATAKTTAKATTAMYTADVVNNLAFSLKSGISASADTTYNHNLNIPNADISSQATMTQTATASLESGTISATVVNVGSGKWSIDDYSDEGTHKSNLEFNINFGTAKLTFAGETNSKAVNMKQTMTAESLIFSHITVEARAETELPFIKNSIMNLNGEAYVEDLKLALTASHNAELVGRMSGTVSNSLEFLARPFELVLECNNKVNSKTIFPFKLTGKVDLQHDYGVILNSEVQRACWAALARFNQYKYYHNFTMDNNHNDVSIYAAMNGEANLDFLTIPLTIPEITVPYLETKTPEIKELSLWEDAGLKNLLTTPQQSFDLNLKLQYQKNPDMHAVDFDLEPIYNAINENADVLRTYFESGRDGVVIRLTESYNKAKSQLDKHKIETAKQPPRIFTVPGYKVPILNIEVSAFRAELPAFSFVIPKEVSTPSFKVPTMGFSVPSYTLVLPSLELPVLHVPETLSELTLPTFTVPDIQNNILIPAMGNFTYDFSFKSSVITMTASAGLYNQSDIVAKFGASSTSLFDILNGKMDGTTSLTKKRGIKLATAMSLQHRNIEGTQDCTISLSKRSMEASLTRVVKVNMPFINLELNQELLGNTKTKPNVASKTKLKYTFNIPLIQVVGKGNIDHNLALEGLSSYISLETSSKGKSDMTLMDNYKVVADIDNEANFHLNANGLRSTVQTDLNSNIDYEKTTLFNLDINENIALEASLRRVYATFNYTSSNSLAPANFLNTNGNHVVKATLDVVPLTTITAKVEVDISQPGDHGDAGIIQNIDLAITSDKQTLSWSGKEQLASVIHTCDLQLSNDESEVRMEVTGSLEGYLAFLKSMKLPVYQKTIWDVLKFDQATSIENIQFLNVSSTVVYTKNMDGLEFTIPAKLFDNGVIFSIPEFTLAVPTWVKEIPHTIRKIDMRLESIDLPDQVVLPPVLSIPAFDVPFTTLHVEPSTIDMKNLEIPKVISTTSFNIMLPYLPRIAVPSFDIDTEYLQNKMAFLSVKLPQYEITISPFTFAKSFSIGGHFIDLDEIANHISNFEIPTITIPEQKMEIPELALHLPASVFIPAFGAFSATVKVSSPIYNVTTTAKVENKDSSLVTSLKSTCTSTVILVEYDLDAIATVQFENGALSLNGKCNLVHSDVNIEWQHVLAQNLRMKRQVSPETIVSRHTLNVDVTSPSFVDVSFRYASRKDGITASVSSPSSGFLGFLLQRRSPSQVYGKLFSRYLSTPDKDTDIVSVRATLRNSEKLSLQTAWNLDGLHHIMEGTKDRTPAVTDALLKFINKHHTAHFGYDVNRISMKLKNSVSNVIERAYHEVPMNIDLLQNSLVRLSDQGQQMYSDTAGSVTRNVQELKDKFVNSAREVLGHSHQTIKVLLDAAMKFLSDTTFNLPGFEEKLSGQEIYRKVSQSVSMSVDRAVERFSHLVEAITDTVGSFVRGIEFTIPGANIVVNGKEILESVRSAMGTVKDQIVQAVRGWEDVSLEMLLQKASDLFQRCVEKVEELIASLRAENVQISSDIDGVYAEIQDTLEATKRQLEEAKRSAAEYKDVAKRKVQEVYNGLTRERVNNDLKDLVGVFQSHLYGGLNESIDLMRQATLNTAPYLRVSNKKMDVDVPLPFFWKSFSEWPTHIRQ